MSDPGGLGWSDVVGQPRAVGAMRSSLASPHHAYLLVGPRGAGKRALALAFAAELLAGSSPDPERTRSLVLGEAHPDLEVVEREGASISADQAAKIVERASRSPVEGAQKVLLLDEFHLVSPAVGPKLLKTVEEPPPGTTFLILAEEVTPDLVTLASRCVRVELGPVPEVAIAERLVAEGVREAKAAAAAASAAGDLRRARVLATDERLAIRQRLWEEIPSRLDGTGAVAAACAEEVLAAIEDSMAVLRHRQEAELEELVERVERTGERGAGRRQLVERHKREERRHRTDELRFGLGVLARAYGTDLRDPASSPRAVAALGAISQTSEALVRNPNERLQLQALFVRLSRSPGSAR